jgi:peroxiredoxin
VTAGGPEDKTGVSVDDDSHAKFATKHSVRFPLVADRDRKLVTADQAVGAIACLLGGAKPVDGGFLAQ